MKVLFVLSRDVMFFHGSGEVEAKLLQLGIQLLGHECHIAGLDSGDFFDYDAYFLFSVRQDVLELFGKIPQQRHCVIIPQVDDMDAAAAVELNRRSQHLENLSVLGRTAEEVGLLGNLFPGRRTLLAEGWFLKPFIHQDKSPVEYSDKQAGYCLCMVSADRDTGLAEMASTFQHRGQRLHVVSDRPDEHGQRLKSFDNVRLEKRVPYGSLEWYMRLENCSSLYEPNPRLTCAVLEALWMGKRVFSPHADYINSVIGADLVIDSADPSIWPSLAPCRHEVQNMIYRYHANFIAAKIFDSIGGGADA
ncbi:hypothetical protein GCM10027046_27610 [Uliginosibacterium flavum]|uniref:Glycosyltransferase family 1 protein n=1 Tax=Uliginosibacterium flavum TaxID=1396831 RepID=A0ABV2TM70_9RHOO